MRHPLSFFDFFCSVFSLSRYNLPTLLHFSLPGYHHFFLVFIMVWFYWFSISSQYFLALSFCPFQRNCRFVVIFTTSFRSVFILAFQFIILRISLFIIVSRLWIILSNVFCLSSSFPNTRIISIVGHQHMDSTLILFALW